jgi:hypothetical protein
MKYMLLFCDNAEDVNAWASLPKEAQAGAWAEVGAWFERNQAQIQSTNALEPQTASTTVTWNQQMEPIVTDGPFTETGEVVGGYCIVDVANLDEALAMAKTWPGHGPRGGVEIRPIIER